MEVRRRGSPQVDADDAMPASQARIPHVVIVGRPNVGKSTVLNRLAGRRAAIVAPAAGITRDRKTLPVQWRGRDLAVSDTGGWLADGTELDDKVSLQSSRALDDADLALVVVDAQVGPTVEDEQVARWVRRSGRPALLIANKVDGAVQEANLWAFLQLGFDEPQPLSALHGRGSGDLLDLVLERLDELEAFASEEPEVDPASDRAEDDSTQEAGAVPAADGEAAVVELCAVAVVGRPNVGKSTLFNRMIGEDRAVVHDMPGTTRDTVDTLIETDIGAIRFVDTAGMRRSARVSAGEEYYSVLRALDAVDSADIAVLVIDATEGVTHQDQRLAERVDAAGCPIVIALNKWELLSTERKHAVSYQVQRRLGFLGEPTVLRISALTGMGVHKLLSAIDRAMEAYSSRAPTQAVNKVIKAAQQAQAAPNGARVLYATQGASDPPTFTLFTNKELPQSYLRYLQHQLSDAFGLGATAMKLRVRRRG